MISKEDFARFEKLARADELTAEEENELDILAEQVATSKTALMGAVAHDAASLEHNCRVLQLKLNKVSMDDVVKVVIMNGLLTSAVAGLVLGELQAKEEADTNQIDMLSKVLSSLKGKNKE